MRTSKKKYSFNGLAGCVVQRVAQQTGTRVGVYHAEQAGMDTDPKLPWASVCEVHHALVLHPGVALAILHASDPQGWCEECRRTDERCDCGAALVDVKTREKLTINSDDGERCPSCGLGCGLAERKELTG